ncbi:MAG: 30S ribosomal protein S18 [Ruminococcaceae bacterium]|nr:30S ribosomal protein S18 [Oscillospiraceae bacterium]
MDKEIKEVREPRDAQKTFRPRKKKKVCFFCAEKIEHIDYKNVGSFRKNLSERSKILPRRITGTCAKHQRQLTIAVKRARELALVPYISD